MANKDNLIPQAHVLTVEEQSMGGKRSVEARKAKKTYREMAKAMLSATIEDEGIIEELQAYGIEERDVKAYTLLGIIKASGKGSHNAFEILMELTGEREKDENSDVMAKLDSVIGEVDKLAQ